MADRGRTRRGALAESDAVSAANPLYAVNLDQHVTQWSEMAERYLATTEEAMGASCYEVMARVNPLNARRCRPNCQIIAMARGGRAAPDFMLHGPETSRTRTSMSVSILLSPRPDGETEVLHLVRCPIETSVNLDRRTRGFDLDASVADELSLSEGADPLLTPRQVEVLRHLAAGRTPDEIASDLRVRPITVRNHIQAAMDRLGARTRLEAVMIGLRHRLIDDAAMPGED